ncbi:MAG TPA: hypothetical protein P5056_00975 [Candidatus Paceibacterota bacterium]|nr:hypothetical protein [Candidatus Paceibacterota bacterium]
MPKPKKAQNEEGGAEVYESFDENLDAALSEDALEGITASDDDFDPETALGLDIGSGSDGI